jgi:hypothetical protein
MISFFARTARRTAALLAAVNSCLQAWYHGPPELRAWEAGHPEIWTEADPRRHFQPADRFRYSDGRMMKLVRVYPVACRTEVPRASD